MAEQISIQGLRLVLDKTPSGPLISTTDPATEPLAWLINSAVAGRLRDLRESLDKGESVDYEGLKAVSDLAGNYELSGDFFSSRVTIPRAVVIEVLETIQKLRVSQERTEPVPVILPHVRIDPAPIGPRPDLPTGWEDLERRAAELDALTTRQRTAENKAEEACKRRFLLLDLRDKGVFEQSFVTPPALVVIQSYRDAGLKVASYLGSPERFELNPEARVQDVIGSPVSLDWFRGAHQRGPSHLSPMAWLAFLENMLTRNEVRGNEGEIFVRAEDWWSLFWRADDGDHPCVVSASQSSKRNTGS
jgi:hypothetical protein